MEEKNFSTIHLQIVEDRFDKFAAELQELLEKYSYKEPGKLSIRTESSSVGTLRTGGAIYEGGIKINAHRRMLTFEMLETRIKEKQTALIREVLLLPLYDSQLFKNTDQFRRSQKIKDYLAETIGLEYIDLQFMNNTFPLMSSTTLLKIQNALQDGKLPCTPEQLAALEALIAETRDYETKILEGTQEAQSNIKLR